MPTPKYTYTAKVLKKDDEITDFLNEIAAKDGVFKVYPGTAGFLIVGEVDYEGGDDG